MADINLKTLTPDTSLPTTGFLFGADSQASTNPSVYGVTTAITAILGNAASSDALVFNSDTTFSRAAIRNFRFGAADAASALAQTLSVQSVVAGTSNTAGATFTINGSQGTGTGAGGNLIFQTAPAGGSGTSQNTLSPALTIDATNRIITFTGNVYNIGGGSSGNWNFAAGTVGGRQGLAMGPDPASNYIYWMNNVTFGMSTFVTFGWYSSFANPATTPDTNLSRVASGIVKVTGSAGTGPGVVVTNSTVVASLPAAATAGAGARAFVTNASMSMALGIGTVVAGGGANAVPVYSDGTNWLIG